MQQASVPSSPNPRRIRPYQPRRCSSQGLVLSRPYSSLSMKGAEKHRFPAVRAVEERTTSAGWRHDISRFSDLLLCPPVRRDIPCCSRTDLTADGSGFRSDARTRLRLRLATRASTKGRSREVPSAWERATCLSRAAAAKARFILPGWVSRFWSIRDKTGDFAHVHNLHCPLTQRQRLEQRHAIQRRRQGADSATSSLTEDTRCGRSEPV